ncbi:hypothetical protein ACROYT_G009651 [Oculina patagonica]
MKDLSVKLQTTVQPVFVSRKIGQDLLECETKPKLVNQQCVVYQFKCNLCDTGSYVGYTRGHLHARVDGHKSTSSSVRKHYDNNHAGAVPEDLLSCFKVLKKCKNKFDCLVNEMLYIKQLTPSLNVQTDSIRAKKITKTKKPSASAEPTTEFKSTAVLPYVKGLSEQLRRCLQQQGVRAVFKSETTLRSHLVRPKDAVDPTKQDGVVYRIRCECGKVYIGETGRPMRERIKEHDRDIRLARIQTSAVSEHTHNTGHYPLWNEVKFIDREPHWYTRRVKEAIQIRLHPNNINRDSGIEIPEAWMPTIKKHNTRRTERPRTLREQQHTGTARIEMHQSQLLKTNQSQHSSVLYKVTPDQSTLSPDED